MLSGIATVFFASTVQLFEKGLRRRGMGYEMIGR